MIDLYRILFWAMLAIVPFVFAFLLFIPAPYGRHSESRWGPRVSSKVGWLIMEAPASLLMGAMIFLIPFNPVIFTFFLIWQVHYFHRAFVYPFSLLSQKRMPLIVVVSAVIFNLVNSFLNGYHFVLHEDWYGPAWLSSWHFTSGAILFGLGYYITKRSDSTLKSLRERASDDYTIPNGFLYRFVSCPNYLGETVQWFGWALLTLSPAAFLFLAWTIANLLPRALSHHRWYLSKFPDYPKNRRAYIPFVL